MRGLKIFKKQGRMHDHFPLFLVCIMVTAFLPGCGHSTFEEANSLFNQGKYLASLNKYEQLLGKSATNGDRVLFEMGFIYSYPKNEKKDYQKALECFQKLIKDYPDSEYRRNSEMMIFSIHNVAIKDKTIAAQQTQIETLREEVEGKDKEVVDQQKMIEALLDGSADKVVIEKKARRLMLISKGEVLKTYKIALGKNPTGPKERQGDNKTPEGTYVIDSRNRDSRYSCSLHISYPNERDKERARELGVSPGGDIMIHGLKNGFSWMGDAHAKVDWTQGCIAVTDEEIKEIDKLVPNGTIVEIRP
jgi:L,D-peptidoglycan transpeptidase YkuD (ErfK/YbiS/YcfS/YnhG family)